MGSKAATTLCRRKCRSTIDRPKLPVRCRPTPDVWARLAKVRLGSNREELTQGTHFRVAPNNRHGAERKRLRLPSAAKPLRAASGQSAFGLLENIADGRIAIAHCGPRDGAGGPWSEGLQDTLLPIRPGAMPLTTARGLLVVLRSNHFRRLSRRRVTPTFKRRLRRRLDCGGFPTDVHPGRESNRSRCPRVCRAVQ